MTTDEKIDLLTKDFLERDENNHFVRIRRTGRLGWEDTLPKDGAYSEFILKPQSKEELIKNAYRMACDTITVMDAPFKVNIRITPDQSCTDSRTVWVATKVFDDENLSIGKKLDTFIGLTVHEGCHLLNTDFTATAALRNDTVRALQNMIEDERIERVCGESKPGLANFLAATKYYYFDRYLEELTRNGNMADLSPFKRLMNCILSYVRYPKSLILDDLREFADVMLGVRSVLTPYPESTQEAIDAAWKIYDLMKQYMEKTDNKDKSGEGNAPEGQDSQGEGDKAQGGGQSAEQQMAAETRQMAGALDNLSCNSGEHGLDENQMSETLRQDNTRVGAVCEGRLERGLKKGSYIEKAPEDKDVYNKVLGQVKPYVSAISRALKFSSTHYRLSLRGMRSGVLDTGKLAEAYQGVQTVYMREGEVRSDKVAICVLIDESGSMWGPGEEAARKAAVLLNEALSDVSNVDLYIYGHTASTSITSLYVYKERGFNARYSLGSTDSRAGNHDSVAIQEACARVRRFTKEKCLFFMISDGAPNESPETVKKAVKDVEKDGFEVVAISIDPYYDPSTMYDKNVNLTNLATLAPELGKMVKKAIMENTKKQLNY